MDTQNTDTQNIIFQSNLTKNIIISMINNYDKQTIIDVLNSNKNKLVDFHIELLEWLINDIPD